jgi:squalene-hopene/tetraprenyl-beta-curcumene cyclase
VQGEDGSWSLPQFPALTSLAVLSFCADPRRSPDDPLPEAAEKGIAYLLRCVQPDGGIYIPQDAGGGLPYYNTALAMTALVASGKHELSGAIEQAQKMLAESQHLGEDVHHGGFGYGEGDRQYADLSNTYMVLEAFWMAERNLAQSDRGDLGRATLDWEAALSFLSRVQNLSKYNDQPWASQPEQDDVGGFVYHPGESKAGERPRENGPPGLRSYGSMSYAGLLSFIYAGVDKHDERVLAAVDWIKKHYTVDENPGMGAQGLYYSYHTMAKALAVWGEDPLLLQDGQEVDWRIDLVQKLVNLQRIDPESGLGYWVNDNGRWWENDPVLATSYALLAIEISARPWFGS